MRITPTTALFLPLVSMFALAFSPSSASAKEAPIDFGPTDFGPTEQCIDKAISDRLAVKRKRRGSVDRLFIKQARHEFSFGGGYYVSGLFSGTYVLNGSYTFHMTETTAVEIGGAFTHANADIIRAIEDQRGVVLEDDFATVRFVESLLLWTPVYGKLRLGGSIARFDIHVDMGVGVVDSATSRGATGVAGIGSKLFIGDALALRIDLRNHVFRQELLDESFLVNDLSLTAGLSVFFPFSN
ncbi:MAG: outer membrane beta-barrel domain-containing protein [Kofleriaceae bacterium]|nr:outer membrane beta-barrel domain-containing protein [Kofleriaceae bacterium]